MSQCHCDCGPKSRTTGPPFLPTSRHESSQVADCLVANECCLYLDHQFFRYELLCTTWPSTSESSTLLGLIILLVGQILYTCFIAYHIWRKKPLAPDQRPYTSHFCRVVFRFGELFFLPMIIFSTVLHNMDEDDHDDRTKIDRQQSSLYSAMIVLTFCNWQSRCDWPRSRMISKWGAGLLVLFVVSLVPLLCGSSGTNA